MSKQGKGDLATRKCVSGYVTCVAQLMSCCVLLGTGRVAMMGFALLLAVETARGGLPVF